MGPHRQVPQIGRGPQQFTRPAPIPIQSPMMIGQPQQPPQPQQSQQDAIAEDIQDLAMEIYSQLAVDHIRKSQAPDAQTLRDLAKSAQLAARAYFESMGVLT